MRPALNTLITDYFFKDVQVVADSGAKFSGFFVGIKLPAGQMVMLHLVEHKHIEKYIRHQNARWHFPIPYETIREITLAANPSQDLEDRLHIAVLKAQEK